MHILHIIFNIYNIYKNRYIIKYDSHYTFKNIFLYCTNWKKLLYIFCSFSKIILLSINSFIMLNKFITNPFSFIFDMKTNNCEIVVNLWSNTITNNCNHMILFRLAYGASWKTAIRVKIDISKIKKRDIYLHLLLSPQPLGQWSSIPAFSDVRRIFVT